MSSANCVWVRPLAPRARLIRREKSLGNWVDMAGDMYVSSFGESFASIAIHHHTTAYVIVAVRATWTEDHKTPTQKPQTRPEG